MACHRPMTVADLASHLMHSPMTGPAGSLCQRRSNFTRRQLVWEFVARRVHVGHRSGGSVTQPRGILTNRPRLSTGRCADRNHGSPARR